MAYKSNALLAQVLTLLTQNSKVPRIYFRNTNVLQFVVHLLIFIAMAHYLMAIWLMEGGL